MKILFVPARRVVVPARRRPVVPARQRGGKAGVGGGGKKSPHCSVVMKILFVRSSRLVV
jgi:hypothetical protein